MKPKNKAAIAVAFAQLGIQIARIFHTRQQREKQQAIPQIKAGAAKASGKVAGAYDRMPHRKRRIRARRRNTSFAAAAVFTGVIAAAGVLARRRPAHLPSTIEAVKADLQNHDVAKAAADGVMQTATNVAAGTSETAGAVIAIAKAEAHEKVIDPAVAKVKRYTIMGVLALVVLVLVVAIIGSALGDWLYSALS